MTKKQIVKIGDIECGGDELFLIAGPCVIEDRDTMHQTAEFLKELSIRQKIPMIFKSSFTKDNRSSLDYYRGPGLEEGLRILQDIREQYSLPVLSDIHYPSQAKPAGDVLDVIQIPAYLCMQTELVTAAAATGKVVNLKHGQFLAPENMSKPAEKCASSGNRQIILTERGYTFGYNDLVVDPRSFYWLNQTPYPVVFDITHSIRRYGIPSADPSGGNREVMPTIARAGVAAGVDGIFVETHPNPSVAKCDAASQMSLDHIEDFIIPLRELHNTEVKFRTPNRRDQ